MKLSGVALHRTRLWRHLPHPLADRVIVWGNHAASQPEDGTLGGLMADWRRQDPRARDSLPPETEVSRLAKAAGFIDGSVRLTLDTTIHGAAGVHQVAAYGHLVEPLPEDGGDDIVFQVARLVDMETGQQFMVPGGHHAVADWDIPGAEAWQE